MKKSLPALFMAVLVSYLLFSCGSVKEPELKEISAMRVSQLGLKESTLSFDLEYFNPNNFQVKLKEAEGDVWLDEKLLGHFTIDTLIHIPARADFRLPVKLKADMNQLLKNSLAALLNKEVLIKIQGSANIGKGLIFIRYPIWYEGKENLGELLK